MNKKELQDFFTSMKYIGKNNMFEKTYRDDNFIMRVKFSNDRLYVYHKKGNKSFKKVYKGKFKNLYVGEDGNLNGLVRV